MVCSPPVVQGDWAHISSIKTYKRRKSWSNSRIERHYILTTTFNILSRITLL